MSRLHICNTFFEKELETPTPKSLCQWIRSHPILLQLQFLPLLYAQPNDQILVSDLPENPDPRLCLLDQPPPLPIEDWGPSPTLSTWAQSHNLPYSIPDPALIRTINSKVFSFTHSPKLPGAELLETPEQVQSWIQKTPDPKVLKTPFGTAGNGHIHNPKDETSFWGPDANVKRAIQNPKDEASLGAPNSNVKRAIQNPKKLTLFGGPDANVKRLYICPLIGEPWVERVLDFSTQWKNGELIGVTVFENEPNGTYKGTFAADVEPWALNEHLSVATPLVKKIASMGYSGHIGIDAFIYLWQGQKRLHPIVEINARKTMSWVALQLPQKRLYYTRSNIGLLPSSLKTVHFRRNIICT